MHLESELVLNAGKIKTTALRITTPRHEKTTSHIAV